MRRLIPTSCEPGTSRFPRAAPLVAQGAALFLTAFVVFFLRLPLAADPIARADPPPPPSELVGERTATSRTFDNRDGTYTTRLYSGPVHFRDTQGQWRPISSALVPTGESGYAFENEANRFRTFFKSMLANDFLALETGGSRWRLTLQNAAQVAAQTGPRRITYPGVFPGVDLAYRVRPDGVKETLLLQNAQAQTSYRFLLTPPASARVHAARLRDGTWAFFSAPHARPVFVLDAPWAAENDEPVANRRHASLAVTRIGDVFALDLSVDGTWLRAPGRQFPVRLDPTITIQPPFQDASFDFACSGCTGVTSDRLSIGTSQLGGFDETWRSALQFSLADIPAGATVSSAKLKLYFDGTCIAVSGPTCGGTSHQLDVLRMTNSWSPSSTVAQLSYNATPLASFTLPNGAQAQWMNWDITSTVQDWVPGVLSSNFGLLLKRTPESANASGPQPPSRNYAAEPTLGPTLEVTYNGDGGELLEPETVHSNGAELRWIPYGGPGAPPLSSYEVHRSSNPVFTPSSSTLVTKVLDGGVTSYRDTTAKPGATFTYKVLVSGYETNSRTVTMPADGQARKLLRPDPTGGHDTYFTYRTDSVECTNRGTADRMKVGTDTNSLYRSLLRFDLGDLPIDTVVSEATLSLWHPETVANAVTVKAHRLTSAWQPGMGKDACTGDGATWYESDGGVEWVQDGGDFDATAAATLSVPAGQLAGWHSFTLTSLVQSWGRGDYPNDGVLLKVLDETIAPGKYVDYYASDFGVAPTLRPKLSITYSEASEVAAPVVTIRKPAPSEQVAGSSVTIAAEAFDDRRVDSVQFLVDGNSVGSDSTEPFSVTWNSTTVGNGSHSLTARATDDAGNQTTSAAVGVTVGNATPPTTSVASPTGGTVVGTVAVFANASPGVTKVEFYADGYLFATDTAAPWTASWNTLDSALPAYDGDHTLTTKAYAAFAPPTTSAPVTVTAANAEDTKYLADFSSTAFPPSARYDPALQTQEEYGINLTVTNTSGFTWAVNEIVLRYRWLSSDGVTTDSGDLSLGSLPIGPGGFKTLNALVEPPDPRASRALYQLRFDLYDTVTGTWFAAHGNKPLEQPVGVEEVSAAEKLGMEGYYEYESLDLGAGMRQLTNVATGNSVIRWVPVSSPGRGLDTTVELTYNSRDRCRGPHSPCLAGNGWSFGVSSVLRFGSAIEEHPNSADLLAGRSNRHVDVIDADGTKHVYMTTDNGAHWNRPDGFHLYLRKVGGNWLLTRPDRTTYAYDGEGFPLYVEDKNLNRITFIPDDPQDPERVVAVEDAGGRRFWISYYDKQDPQIEGLVQTITDHLGHMLEFEYYADGNLRRITRHGGADGDRKFVFNYTHEGGGQSYEPAIPNRADRYDPDPRTAEQSDRIFSVQDPRTIQAHAGNETAFGYENPPGGGQDYVLTTSCDRENASTSSSPCFRANATNQFTYKDDESPCLDATCTILAKPLGRNTTYWYGSDGLVTKIIDPLGRETDQVWLARHLKKVIDQPTGRYVEYSNNANGMLLDEWDQLRNNNIHNTYYDLPADENDIANSISVLNTSADAGGNTTTYVYDEPLKINLLQVIDPLGYSTDYTYYGDGTLHTVEDANHHIDHHQTVYSNYDPNGFAQQVTDAKGQVTKASYDADGLQLWAQDANHTDESDSDPRWFRTYFTYNNFHELIRTTEPKSTHLQAGMLIWNETEYDANGSVTKERGPAYAPAPSSEVPVTTTTYDLMDRPTTTTRPDTDRVTKYQYDAAGRLWRTTLPLGVQSTDKDKDYVTENVYDGLDRVVTEIRYNAETADGLPARKTHYCYDGVGDLRWTVAPMAHLDQAPTGCASGGNPPNYTTRYTYDDAHRLLTETDPLDPLDPDPQKRTRTRRIEYYMDTPARGQIQFEFDEDGTRTEYTYTRRGELETTIRTYLKDASNNPTRTLTSKTVYDPVGNVLCEVAPRAWDFGSRCNPPPLDEGYYTTHYTYDDVDQLVKISLPTDGNQDPECPRTYVHRQYDGNGNMTLTTLPDCASGLSGVPQNKKTIIDNYDPGWIATTNDNVNPGIRYNYQAQGLQTLRETGHRWGKVMRWTYSLGGNLLVTSDRQGTPSTFEYDLNDNLVKAEHRVAGHEGDPMLFDIRSFYNGFDEQTKVRQFLSTDNWRSTKYEYDDNGDLVTRRDDGRERDDESEITPWRIHTFAYDESSQLKLHKDLGTTTTEDGGDERIKLTYKVTGWEETRLLERKNQQTGNWDAKLFTTRDYFPSGDLRSVATHRGADANAPLLERHTLDYLKDNIYLNGNRVSDVWRLVGPEGQTKCRNADCTTSYYYGPRENLTKETRDRGPGDLHWTDYHHDSTMNIDKESLDDNVIRTAEYDGNRLAHVHDVGPPSLDRYFRYEDGNLRCVVTSDIACPAAPVTMAPDGALLEDYRWNGRDRLRSFRRFGQGATSATYAYDPLDRIVTQTDSRGETAFSYLGTTDNVSSEGLTVQGSPAGTKYYSYGPDDERVGMTTSAGGDFYYTRNVHSDVSLLIGANAAEATASYVYRPYGARDLLSNGDPEGSNLLSPYRFNDKRFDSGSSTLDMGARRYTSNVGRFIQHDFLLDSTDDLGLRTDELTQNGYAFAAGNPVLYAEDDGHYPCIDDRYGRCQPPRRRRHRPVRRVYPIPKRFPSFHIGFRSDPTGVHASTNAPGYPAIDFRRVRAEDGDGTPVVAVENGKIRTFSVGSFGLTTYLLGDSGVDYFYTHLGSRTAPVDRRVRVGQMIGRIGKAPPDNVDHVHLGANVGGKVIPGQKNRTGTDDPGNPNYRSARAIIRAIARAPRV